MDKKICIHGHFYQPPREDPWLGRIFTEPSAAPLRHWNERITRESYAPLGWSRRMDGDNKIFDIVNCYEWISFNAGPTLMQWLEREAPEVLARMQEADRKSIERWGNGNAMAQIYHHVIMPLASPLDKELEVVWALEEFRERFGREAEGMWLSECAVDIPTLEVLAGHGIRFVTLSPYQARAVAEKDADFVPVDANSLDISKPYKVELPSKRSIAVFFYHGSLAQSISFDGLLRDGEEFWKRLSNGVANFGHRGGLLSIATDGETYGHHFKFGDMALAYVLAQGQAKRDGISLTNFGSYLAENPPSSKVMLHEPSSWSCAHGVERWRSNCGCTTGGHGGWNQEWRTPLRAALDFMKGHINDHFFLEGEKAFKDARHALLDYGKVLANPENAPSFAAKHFRAGISGERPWKLLRMQENALASFASCAWFFDEISRIEPVKSMSFAIRAMEILQNTGGPNILPEFETILSGAHSNKPDEGTGADILRNRALPGRQDVARLSLFSYLHAFSTGVLPETGKSVVMTYPYLKVELEVDEYAGKKGTRGKAIISPREATEGYVCSWAGILPVPSERALAPLADANIIGKLDSQSFSCKGSELARHLQDFLAFSVLKQAADTTEQYRLEAMLQALSTLEDFEEAQSTLHKFAYWSELALYIPLAAFMMENISDTMLERVARVFNLAMLTPAQRARSMEILGEAVLDKISMQVEDDELAVALHRASMVLPDMDWWGLQNILWSGGMVHEKYKKSAAVIGFKT